MAKRIFKQPRRTNKFRKSVEELKEFVKENDINLLELLKYIRRRNMRKFKKERQA